MGQFRLFWLGAGQYYVAATPALSSGAFATFYPGATDSTTATLINVVSGQEVSGIDIALQTGRMVTISGEIAESASSPTAQTNANPLPPLRVRLVKQPRIGGLPAIEGSFPVVGGRKTTFEFRGVPPGMYRLYANTAANLRSAMSVEVRDQDITGIQVDLRLNVTVPGVVTIDGIAPPTDLTGRIALLAFDPDTRTSFERATEREGVPIAQNGRFSMPDIP
jgi:hypothetical protein